MLLLGFLFSPICALLFLLLYLRMSKIKLVHIAFVVFLISFIGIYWYPWGDNQTHFVIYYSDIANKYYSFLLSSSYWLYDYVIYIIARFFGQYIWGYFFWLFVPFLLLSLVVWKKVNEQDIPHKEKWLLLLLLLMFLGIREYLDLNRNTNAGILLALATLYWNKNKILCVCCLLIALLLHDSIRYLIIFLPLGFILAKQSCKKTDIIILTTIIISGILINIIAPLVVSGRNSMYLEIGGGEGVRSGFMKIMGYVNIAIAVIQYLIIRNNKNLIPKPLYIVYISLVMLSAALASMWVGRERYLLMANILATIIIVVCWHKIWLANGSKLIRMTQWIIASYSMKIILNLMLVYSAHYVFNSATRDNQEELSIVARSVYMPTLLLFDIESYGFSDKEFIKLYDRVDLNIEY